MKPPDEVQTELIQQWLSKAEDDFGLAEYLTSEGSPYWAAIGFHAQQSAEKFLKAFLVAHQVEFEKFHYLGYLLDLVARVDPTLADSLREVTALDPYAVQLRYPASLGEKDFRDTTWALSLARKVRDSVRRALRMG